MFIMKALHMRGMDTINKHNFEIFQDVLLNLSILQHKICGVIVTKIEDEANSRP